MTNSIGTPPCIYNAAGCVRCHSSGQKENGSSPLGGANGPPGVSPELARSEDSGKQTPRTHVDRTLD
jgi:hypothetical protein